MAVRLTKLVDAGIAAGHVPAHLRPTRVALLDPYWSLEPRSCLGNRTTGDVVRQHIAELIPSGMLLSGAAHPPGPHRRRVTPTRPSSR